MANDDFRFSSAGMEGAIADLRSSKSKTDELAENIKSVIRENLLQEGIQGEVAEALLATYEEEVVKPSLGLSESQEKFIASNEAVKSAGEETMAKNTNIASF